MLPTRRNAADQSPADAELVTTLTLPRTRRLRSEPLPVVGRADAAVGRRGGRFVPPAREAR